MTWQLLLFSSSVVSDSATASTSARQVSYPSLSPGVAQTHVHWDGDAIHQLILCHPLLLLPSIFPSIRVFSNESALRIRWPKYWSFSISPSNEYSGLISFRIDWFDFLVVQGTLKSLLQYHSSKASVLQHSAFFMVQLNFMVQRGKPYNKSKSFCPRVSILPTHHWPKKVMLQPDISMMGIDDPPAQMFLNNNVNYVVW